MDYMNIALREGGVSISINLGSGLFETEVKPHRGSIRFDDNKWHKLVVSREAREVSMAAIEQNSMGSGPHLNIKIVFPKYGDSHGKDKTVARPSYLYHGDPYTDKMTSFYWDSPQIISQYIP